MKSERRHELQQNMLKQWLLDTWEWIKKQSNYLVWGLFVVAVIIAVAAFWHRHNVKKDVEFQTQWQTAEASGVAENIDDTANGLDPLIKEDSNRDRAGTAALFLGEAYATRSLAPSIAPADRDAAREKAKKYYDLVISGFDKQRMKVAKAHIGLAHLAESKADYGTAKDEYQKVIDMTDLTDTAVVAQAASSLKNLELIKAQNIVLATTLPSSAPSSQSTSSATTSATTMPESQPATSKASK